MADCTVTKFYTGNAATITFDSGWLGRIVSFTPPSAVRAVIDNSDISQSVREEAPGDLVTWEDFNVSIVFDPATQPPIDQPAEDITITYADGVIQNFCGFMTNYAPGEATNDERITADVTIRVQKEVIFEDTPSS